MTSVRGDGHLSHWSPLTRLHRNKKEYYVLLVCGLHHTILNLKLVDGECLMFLQISDIVHVVSELNQKYMLLSSVHSLNPLEYLILTLISIL